MQKLPAVLLSAVALFALLVPVAHAVDIANCGSVSGQAYYPQKGPVPKGESGWVKDGISGGKVTLVKSAPDKFDLLYIDTSNRITSSTAEGGKVVPYRINSDDLVVLVLYNDAIDLYNFWKTSDGKFQYSLMQNKGSGSLISKSSVLVGSCDFVNFGAVKQ